MTETKFYIAAMDCPTEEQIIRNGLKRESGIERLDFDLLNRVLTVSFTPTGNAESVRHTLNNLGMEAKPVDRDGKSDEANAGAMRTRWIQMGVAALFAAGAEVLHWVDAAGHKPGEHAETNPLLLVLVGFALLLGGRDTFRKGWVALRTFTLNINFLMTLAIVGAMVTGEYPEAAMVAVLFGIAELIEAQSLDRARNAISALMDTVPDTARVWHSHGDDDPGHWHEMLADKVSVGERVQVRPGERVPLDGRVVEGRSGVSQAAITGESLPVEKEVGDEVWAGSVNGRGVLVFEVKAARGDTRLDRIARAVQEAQAERAPTQRFVDRFALVYTPTVVVLALLLAIVPPLLGYGGWMEWLYKALVLLVIACPCALVLSTPVAVVSGLTAAAKQGLLIKGGAYLEAGAKLKTIAFDKTGTLTRGRPIVTDIIPLGNDSPDALLHLAASLNASSEHPLAAAIVAACASKHECRLPSIGDFEALIGRGVTGKLEGRRYYIGNHQLTEENRVCSTEVESVIDRLEQEGKTPVVLTDDQHSLAVLGVADTIREESEDALKQLRDLGVETILLSGDSQRVTDAVAKQVGITNARGELLPENKLAFIESLRTDKNIVGMVGDGINDAPALAKADIGFSVGQGGSDTAMETADVVLLHGDLRKLPLFVRLARATTAVLAQNIALALLIKAVVFLLALKGSATLWMAVLADVGTSLLVVGNGLRLLRFRSKS
ncbi:MAG: cadmium-translocating P-type ATPase [Fibrella sp.]|nr:cadmium-translocating P-type ATPase [Armatimonadota bacterium]